MAAKKGFWKKVILSVIVILLLTGAGGFYYVYRLIYQPNVSLGNQKNNYIYIKTGSDFNDVLAMLYEKNLVVNRASFEWLAEKKKYKDKVRPGRYRIKAGMSNNELINLLRAGLQEPVQITFHTVRTKEDLVSKVCGKLEADSAEMIGLLNDNAWLADNYGLKRENALTMFIPNTYEFYWNTSAKDFVARMAKEYKTFWNDSRKEKAKKINLSQTEVSVLASIVQAEQNRFDDEKPVIAGLYINRIKKGMPLQSDPTLIYAKGDFTIQRVLNEDKLIDSPYNTYKHTGLPPGPINLPELSSLEAVLNYDKNEYIYMCAKEDFSGRHNFAKTIEQHDIFAAKWRKALRERNIKR